MTWERMASIFKEVGADNILYIFNPTGKTFPYCNWGEDLCFLPSLEYVQILGLTYYEYNNYFDEDPRSFFELYE
jgi:aspartate/tyrosine/aromatic aminotransferase